MSFFQNVFAQEYQGYLNTGNDRQYSLTFKIAANQNTENFSIAYNPEPFDFSSDNTLTINYAWDSEFKNWSALSINVAGSTASDTKAHEVVSALNSDTTFASMFEAKISKNGTDNHVLITAKSMRPKQLVKMYISNSSAEKKLKFNKKAPVVELPSYFEKDTIANRFTFPNSLNHLIKLDESDSVDQQIITDAGLDFTAMQEDWQLLRGRASGIYMFKKQTVDGSSRITEIIEYPAGAIVGDLARKTIMNYTGVKTQPDEIFQIPYVLTSGDLIIP